MDAWLHLEAAARYLGVHRRFISRLVLGGELPAEQWPQHVRRSDLDALSAAAGPSSATWRT